MKDLVAIVNENSLSNTIYESNKETKDKERWKYDVVMQYVIGHLDDANVVSKACELSVNLDLKNYNPEAQTYDYWLGVINELKLSHNHAEIQKASKTFKQKIKELIHKTLK